MATVTRVSPTATSTDVEMMGGNMTFLTVDYVNTNTSTGPEGAQAATHKVCLLYTSPSPRDGLLSRMPSSA